MTAATYTVREVAEKLGVSATTVRESVHRGDLYAIRLGRTIRVPRVVIDQMLDDNTHWEAK